MKLTITPCLYVLLSLIVLGLGCGKEEGGGNGSAPAASSTAPAANRGSMSIAVIPKGTTHVFWKSVEAGANKAGRELGVEILWKGPLKENDRAQQIGIVEQFTSQGVAGIVLAPLDDAALVRPVQAAAAKHIPVVIFDSALKGEVGKDFVSFVATDNRKGGELAGDQLVKLLGGKGKVVLLRYQEGSASTMEREAGFLDAVHKSADIQMLVENRYAGATAGEAKDAAMAMLDQIRAADGIFCPNESSTFGMLLALRQNNLTGKVKFVGFDTSPQLIDALGKGEIDALVAQNPTKMGYEAVKTCVAAIKGETVQPHIDTGVALITKENLNTSEIQSLLKGE
jgi:ribose transport system substrate-binding protein